MYARRARGGALWRTFRIFILVSILIGVVLVTPAPAHSPDVLLPVDQRKVAFAPARLRVRTMMITVSSDEGHEHAGVVSPAIHRVRGLIPIDAYDRFFRSDFTYIQTLGL
jgi:hypothetical protein